MGDESFKVSVGIDCGSDTHHVCVMNGELMVVGERAVDNSAAALAALVDWLLGFGEGDPGRVIVALEQPHGPVVDTLLERGFRVYAINPKQLDRFRERYAMSGAKDDGRDARVAARSVQTDRDAFRAIVADDPLVIQLRTLSRLDQELGDQLTRTANRLRAQLHRYFPQLLRLCPGADEPWLWQLLTRTPTPHQARQLSVADLTAVLRQARVRRITAADLHATLASAPVVVAAGTVEAATQYVAVLLPQLELLHAQRRACAKQLGRLLTQIAEAPTGEGREHPDVTILLSLPGVGVRIGALMLAEAPQPLKTRDYHALRLLAGLAPVTKASGKRRVVTMRYACNVRLRTACYNWARTATQTDRAARQHYTILRAAGHSHPRALRGVADRLLAVLIGMLKRGTLYDHTRRRAHAA